jgi:hypothetical protein
MRAFLCAVILIIACGRTWAATPALDGHASASSSFNVSVTTVAASLTTSNAGDTIIAIGAFSCNGSSGCVNTQTATASSTNLTFTQRTSHARTSGNLKEKYFVFSATASGTLSSESITVTFSAGISTQNSQANIIVFGIQNGSAFDTDASLPSAQDIASGAGPSASVNTAGPSDLLFAWYVVWNGICLGSCATVDSGFTKVETTGSGGFSALGAEYKVYSAAQSGVTPTWNSSVGSQAYTVGIDAVAGAPTATGPWPMIGWTP